MSTETGQEIPEQLIAFLNQQYDAMEAEFAPDICNTLGLMAVKGDLVRSIVLVHAEPWHDTEIPDANNGIKEGLQETRDRLATIDPDNIYLVGSRAIGSKVPQFLLNTIGVDYDHQIFERLVETTADGSPAVPDDVLLNFLQWHNYKMTVKRERFMERDWPRLKQDYKYQLNQGVKAGWLPECVLGSDRLAALEEVEVTVDDGILMYEKGSEAFMTAYDTGSSTEVYFPQFTFSSTSYHELSHVMVGVQLPKDKSEGRFSQGPTTHGLYRLFPKEHVNAGKVIDEAVTEHIAQTMGHYEPTPDVIDPQARSGWKASYLAERQLLDVLCHGGAKPVDIKLFMSAYFEDSTQRRQPALRALKRQLAKAFRGRKILDELGELMSQGEYAEARKGLGNFVQSLRATKASRTPSASL